MNTRLLKHRPLFLFLTLMLINALTVTISQEASASTDGGCQPLVTVTSTDDSGPGTLRQAIADVCAGGVIDFDLPLPNTITLTSGELLVDKAMIIDGPGADQLAVSANHNGRVLHNQADGLHLSGLTIRDGLLFSGTGGGILSLGVMTINKSIIRDNEVDSYPSGSLGGGVAKAPRKNKLSICA